MASLLSAVTSCFGGLATCLPIFSLYYHVCGVSYRAPLSGSQLLDWKNEALFKDKYAFPHLGYKPELAPSIEDGWGVSATYNLFPASDGKGMIQEFACPAQNGLGRALPKDKIRGIVIVLVGLGDSVEKNGHVARFLASKGYAVHGIDYPGYGRSQRDAKTGCEYVPGLVKDWGKEICGSVTHWAKDVRNRYPDAKRMFVVGPSIGGSTALRSCIEAPELFNGAVLLCPAIIFEGSPVLRMLAPIIAFFFPRLHVGEIGDDDIGSKNLANAERIVNDRWRYNRPFLASTGNALSKQLLFVEGNLHRMKVPFVVMHGKKDLVIPWRGSQKLFDLAETSDKSIKYYEDGWHDLLFEPEYKQVLTDIEAWIAARV
jgi:alpha-beta hydrolase superfamily lysophospholipase